MTARHLVEIDADLIEKVAFSHGLNIERSTTEERVYIRLENTTFWAPSPEQVAS